MSRRSMLLSLLLLLALAATGGGILYAALAYEPTFYRLAAVGPGPERQAESRQFERLLHRFINDLRYETEWETATTARLVNSWLAEDFVEQNLAQSLPAGVSQPRVAFDTDVVRLGFRYGNDRWSVVVSLEARLWLPPRETNVLVVEFTSFRAGAIPLSVKMLQDELTDQARDQNIKILWYRLGNNPVAVVRFQADKREPTVQLRGLALRADGLQLKGSSLDPELRNPIRKAMPEPRNVEKPAPPAPPPDASPLMQPASANPWRPK